jgi:hypothetical protein
VLDPRPARQHANPSGSELNKRDATVTVHITATVYPDGHTEYPPAPAAPTTTPPAAAPTTAAAPAYSPVIAAQLDNSKSSSSTSGDLTDADKQRLGKLEIGPGVNAKSSAGGVWIGGGGPYTNNFQNNAGQDLILVVWEKGQGYLVNANNANTALITSSLPAGSSLTISFADGQSGAWAAIYPDTTTLLSGQIKNTIGEYTFSHLGAVDVSRMPTMSGHPMSITGPTPCVSDMNTCVFVCPGYDASTSSSDFCWKLYKLQNCSGPGSQNGYDTNMGGDSGGCSWDGNSAKFTTTFS